MSDLIKFKPKKSYEWYQDSMAIYIGIQIKNTSIRKIDVQICDLILKINHRERKLVILIDLLYPVHTDSLNQITYANNILRIRLVKVQKIHWESLQPEQENDILIKRRQQSFKRKQELIQKLGKTQQQNKHQYDRKATQEIMRLEQQTRDKLQKTKKQERQYEERRIFQQPAQTKPKPLPISNSSYKISQIQQKRINQLIEKHQRLQLEEQKKINLAKKKQVTANSIFTLQQVQLAQFKARQIQQQLQAVPARQAGKISIKLTDKVYPHLAARQQHFKDPPVPKLKKPLLKDGQLQQRNPLFMRDKGDRLMKNGDFYSAIKAYDQVLKQDADCINALSNRILCQMRLFNYQQALTDCQNLINFFKRKPQLSQQKSDLIEKTLLRKSICLAWSGKLLDAQLNLQSLTQSQSKSTIKQIIQARQAALKLKEVGDLELKSGLIVPSIEKYKQSLQRSVNQYALSNLAVCHLKNQNNQQSLDYCQKAIQYISLFIKPSRPERGFSSTSAATQQLLFKNHLRRAMIQLKNNNNKQAQSSITICLLINGQDRQAKQLKADLQKKNSLQKVVNLKDQAKDFLLKGNIQQALQSYGECLKVIPQTQVIQYLAVLQNRLVCYMKLQRWEDIVSTCIRGLRLVRNHKNRIVSFDSVYLNKQMKTQLTQFQARFLVRRANAYLRQGQLYNAKSDIEQGLGLQISESTRSQIQKVRKQIE